MLGRTKSPMFLHHGLIGRPDGAKLSKANHDSAIREVRTAGIGPASLLGPVAFMAGLLRRPHDLPAGELQGIFLQHATKLSRVFSPAP